MIVFIGMETSGALRRRFQAKGFETYSCDLLPSEDGGEEMAYSDEELPLGRHMVGDVFASLENMRANDMWPELAIFHPSCTYLTNSAAWAYGDGPYHQKVKPDTLVGKARREAREQALADVRRIMALPIAHKAIENPIGAIGTAIRRPSQTIQPYNFGDDASKITGLWLDGLPLLTPTKHIDGRMVEWPHGSGRMVERWGNQTDSGQNRLTPNKDRWKDRSRTYPGIADAMVDQWTAFLNNRS